MWLPLALADVVTMLAAVARRAGGDTGELKLPKRSDVLRSWVLPVMSAAVREDEEESDAVALLRSIEKLKEKQKDGKC